jgi:hypothetical protein
MLGMLTSSMPVLPPSNKKSCWGFWVDHILKQKNLGLHKAALLSASTGSVVASSGFSLSDQDVRVSTTFVELVEISITSCLLGLSRCERVIEHEQSS